MPSTLLILDVSDFRAFTAHHPELARAVEAEAARRHNVIEDKVPIEPQPTPQPLENRVGE
jgi:CRP-like cAMP-binding protein